MPRYLVLPTVAVGRIAVSCLLGTEEFIDPCVHLCLSRKWPVCPSACGLDRQKGCGGFLSHPGWFLRK